MICKLDSNDFCARHQAFHRGPVRDIATRADARSERIRRLWDVNASARGVDVNDASTLRCVHRGAKTGDTVDCPTCPAAAKKTADVYQCKVRGRCAPSLDRHHEVTGCGLCKDKAFAGPVKKLVKVLIPGTPKAFNPSIIDYGGKLLFCYRNQWSGSRLWVCEIDRETLQPKSAGVKLDLTHPRCRAGQEDPRLFVFRDRLHVQFSGVESASGKIIVNVMMAILTDDLKVQHVWQPKLEDRQEWEKNWQPFDCRRELYSVYHPHIGGAHAVLYHNSDVVTRLEPQPWNPVWSGGDIRGGAAPVRVGDEYWCFFHSYPWYTMGLYTFDACPPFRPRRMMLDPLLSPDGGIGKPVVFPGGAVKDGDRWLVAFGRNDQHAEIAVLDHAELESRLVVVPMPMKPPSDRATPTTTKSDVYGVMTIPDDADNNAIYREVCQDDCYGFAKLKASGLQVRVAVDLGASCGAASRMMRHHWPSAKIIAFEPDAVRYGMLTVNCPTVDCRNVAVAGFAGDREKMLAGVSTDARWREKPETALEGIAPVSVADSLAGVDWVDLFKIDVEGFELGIFQEMSALGLLTKTKEIVGEWHFSAAKEGLAAILSPTHDCEFRDQPDGNPWNLFSARLKQH